MTPTDEKKAVLKAGLSRKILAWLLLAGIVAGASWLRFHNLDQVGLDGSDTVYYTELATEWNEGRPVTRIAEAIRVYRPVVLGLYALSYDLFGFHDHAIKSLNGSLDVLNVLLVFCIGRVMTGGSWAPSLAAAACYAFLPAAVWLSRTELTHIVSATSILLTLLVFALSRRARRPWPRRLLLALAAALTGLASLTHQELVFLAAGYAIFMALDHLARERRVTLDLGIDLAIYTAVTTLFSLDMLIFSLRYPYRHSVEDNMLSWGHLLTVPEQFLRYVWTTVLAVTSPITLILFLACCLLSLGLLARSLWRPPSRGASSAQASFLILPVLVFLIHQLLLAQFIKELPPRVVFPLIPMVLLTLCCWAWRPLVAGLGALSAGVSMALVAALLTAAHWVSAPGVHVRFNPQYAAAWQPLEWKVDARRVVQVTRNMLLTRRAPRIWHDLLKDRVDEDSRLLVASSLMQPFAGRRVLQVDFYFGDDAVLMIDHDEPLDALIAEKKIRYVLLTPHNVTPLFLEREKHQRYLYDGRWEWSPLDLGASYGFAPGEYSLEKEMAHWLDFLEARGAERLYSGGMAHVSRLRQPGDLLRALTTPGASYAIFEIDPEKAAPDPGTLQTEAPQTETPGAAAY
ncbi:MAG: hypothetical protein AAF725_18525 [Acidobacteriota bacterium]